MGLSSAWLGELMALVAVMLAWPLGWIPRRAPAGYGPRPVVLLHGWSLNRASMEVLAARLRRDGRQVFAVNYPSMQADADAKGAVVAARLREISAATGGGRVDVVAHSLGGVVIRVAATEPGMESLVGNVVTLGSPHRGSALALLWGGAGLGQLRPGSRFLETLTATDKLSERANVTAIASRFDFIVFPLDLAYYAGALNVTIEDVGHHSLLFSQRVYGLVKENLDVAPREPRL
ncbi:MAG: alpha/beta fold hydrolase [Myxococcales bacterium]|nr:MAG: alpha/beta fold hydrolase [Myxococcales bacterium]